MRPSSICLLFIALSVVFSFGCKKSNNTSGTTTNNNTVEKIDSMVGYYYGTTSGDSIYSYSDSTGTHQWLNSFSWADTLVVTSPDTININIASKYYAVNFYYGDSLTMYDSVTNLQNSNVAQNGYVISNAIFSDTANGVNHIAVSVWYGYAKHLTSNFKLYKRK